MLDLDVRPRALAERTEAREADVAIGADRFSYTRADNAGGACAGSKIDNQV